MLSKVAKFPQQPTGKCEKLFRLNVWANKEILDWLTKSQIDIQQVIGISSGAAKNGSAGNGPYSISKAGLNSLLQVYAAEVPETHFAAVAPGLVDTNMFKTLSSASQEFELPGRLLKAAEAGRLLSPTEAAKLLLSFRSEYLKHQSGSFLDVRDLK